MDAAMATPTNPALIRGETVAYAPAAPPASAINTSGSVGWVRARISAVIGKCGWIIPIMNETNSTRPIPPRAAINDLRNSISSPSTRANATPEIAPTDIGCDHHRADYRCRVVRQQSVAGDDGGEAIHDEEAAIE